MLSSEVNNFVNTLNLIFNSTVALPFQNDYTLIVKQFCLKNLPFKAQV